MKRNTSYLLTMLVVLLLGFASCTRSTEDGAHYGTWDEDNSVSLDDREFGNAWGESGYYDRWDANSDGFVDATEWTEGRGRNMPSYTGDYSEWDADADDRLSEDEFRQGIYGYYDRDGDRMINEEEYNAWYSENQ
ncbi:hypothetical protein [Cesiribacter sp. SM1]|uniref:hypothetical protein n=1 Tax=Cesiribacter sp. SM1 TaxID=2861196 RepID=UPI001CD49B08|nr:hypothetical protein [Cesiribacter sp. SM1]